MFWQVLAHISHENALVRAKFNRIQREQQEKLRKQKLLENLRKMLSAAEEEVAALGHSASLSPQQTYVKSQFLVLALEKSQLVPETFEDMNEKEQVGLLWTKLRDCIARSRDLLSDWQYEESQRCLEAASIRDLILRTLQWVRPYEGFQRIKPQRDQAQLKHHKILTRQILSWVIIALVADFTFLLYVGRVGIQAAGSVMIIWLIAGCSLGVLTYLVLERQEPKDLAQLENRYWTLFRYAVIDDQVFWQSVIDQFGRVPTEQQLHQKLAEQEATIAVVLGNPGGNPYAHLSSQHMEDDYSPR